MERDDAQGVCTLPIVLGNARLSTGADTGRTVFPANSHWALCSTPAVWTCSQFLQWDATMGLTICSYSMEMWWPPKVYRRKPYCWAFIKSSGRTLEMMNTMAAPTTQCWIQLEHQREWFWKHTKGMLWMSSFTNTSTVFWLGLESAVLPIIALLGCRTNWSLVPRDCYWVTKLALRARK